MNAKLLCWIFMYFPFKRNAAHGLSGLLRSIFFAVSNMLPKRLVNRRRVLNLRSGKKAGSVLYCYR